MPNPTDTNHFARITLRMAPDALGTVKRAAEIAGRSVSEFMLAAARAAAERAIEEAHIRLSLADQARIATILASPLTAGAAPDSAAGQA